MRCWVVPVTRDVLVERVRYLRDVQRSIERGIEVAVGFVLASPIVNLFIRAFNILHVG